MSREFRIIDADANRAREALRVMEDAARFALDDRPLAAEIKAMRDELRSALAALPGGESRLAANRDMPGDVGTSVSTEGELNRTGIAEVARAAGKRLTEALRSMEEYAKVIEKNMDAGSERSEGPGGGDETGKDQKSLSPGPSPRGRGGTTSARIEALRYRAYEVEKRLVIALGAGRADFAGWRLCVLLSESLCAHHSWQNVALAAMDAGADCIQLREIDLSDRELLARARWLVRQAKRYGASVIVNDRPDIALLAGADGVHLGEDDLRVEDVRRLAGSDLLVGVSTHNLDDAPAAHRGGADYCGVGPMFASTTKQRSDLAGPGYLREYLSHEPRLPPALAIGGVTADRVGELTEAAAGRPFGLAVSSAVCSAKDPSAACRELLSAIRNSGSDP